MKLISFLAIMTTALMSQASTYLSCSGRIETKDPNAGGYMGEENISLVINSHPSLGVPQFTLQKHRDRWNLGGGSVPVRPAAAGDYILFGGKTQFTGSIIGQTVDLIATGSVDHSFNYGPIPFHNGKTINVASVNVLSADIAILKWDQKNIGLTCIVK